MIPSVIYVPRFADACRHDESDDDSSISSNATPLSSCQVVPFGNDAASRWTGSGDCSCSGLPTMPKRSPQQQQQKIPATRFQFSREMSARRFCCDDTASTSSKRFAPRLPPRRNSRSCGSSSCKSSLTHNVTVLSATTSLQRCNATAA
ncbi:expressed unknown protein [Seminavis robusta]|uniref:Uncharacterized protein n=1 Tax=Seminavis robusta TaxID=568900 RepID=A0A9N8DFS3_9STRA|nr:expressed unknown protein [Seminavis robusta]|eukprot:Sro136_g064060.1 n/a (148) ;mRNA; r:44020-44463